MTTEHSAGEPDDLRGVFDPAVAQALREYAGGIGCRVRLPSITWQAKGYGGTTLVAIYLEGVGRTSDSVRRRAVIVKVLPQHARGPETRAHCVAHANSPKFASRHLVEQVGDRYPVGDGRFLALQALRGSLVDIRTLDSLPLEFRAEACERVVSLLLSALDIHGNVIL